jgi:hypothetical protein
MATKLDARVVISNTGDTVYDTLYHLVMARGHLETLGTIRRQRQVHDISNGQLALAVQAEDEHLEEAQVRLEHAAEALRDLNRRLNRWAMRTGRPRSEAQAIEPGSGFWGEGVPTWRAIAAAVLLVALPFLVVIAYTSLAPLALGW